LTAAITASVNPIIVNKQAGESSGTTTIKYIKERRDELWERMNSGTWTQINVHVRTGLGDEADSSGSYLQALSPGIIYEVGMFEDGHGPLSSDPIRQAFLTVFCLWKKPGVLNLISDMNRATGGTWHSHQIATKVPTNIVIIGCSRTKPVLDSNGIPLLQSPDGEPTAPLTTSNNHIVEIKPLLPGNDYFFAVVVVDAFGNWDVKQETFTTLKRKLIVQFKTLHVYNDGDPMGHGEGEFWFRVHHGPANQPKVIEDFHLPVMDIDDWGETDRPYGLSITHLGGFETVQPGEERVSVASWGLEHDGVLEADEGAGAFGTDLQLPSGRFVETVINNSMLMDCPHTTDDDDFHYGIDVFWSVEYK
jgi:hypothetical protein